MVLIFGLAFSEFLTYTSGAHNHFYKDCLGAQMSTGLTTLVYQKTLRISSATNKKYNQGQIVNFLQKDAQQLKGFAMHIAEVAQLPFLICLCVGYLFLFLGWSFCFSLGLVAIFFVYNYFMANKRAKI